MPNRNLLPPAVLLALCIFGRSAVHASDSLPAAAENSPRTEKCCCIGKWFVCETENFQACSLQSQATARLLAETAETLRGQLEEKWLGDGSPKSWGPKCQIVLHPNLESYVGACGPGSEHTVGSSSIKTEDNHVAGRRIDLLGGDRTDFLTASLPHELTHVILRDRFTSHMMPRWADEGAAILADTDAKQGRHFHDLELALRQHTTFDAARLLSMDDYPRPEQVGVFYGESASLAEFLVSRGRPATFVDFIELASAKGYDAALRQCYSISSVNELEHLWRQQVELTLNGQMPHLNGATLAAR